MRLRSILPCIVATLALLATGCLKIPPYQKPTAAVPQGYKETPPEGWKEAQPSDGVIKGKWWEIFNDPKLSRLEEDANEANQQLKAAVAAFQQARAFVDVERSGYFPHVALTPSVTRERDSANRPINGLSIGKSETFNTFAVPLNAGYEVDSEWKSNPWGVLALTLDTSKFRHYAPLEAKAMETSNREAHGRTAIARV